MKTIKFLTLLTLFIGFASCDSDDDPPTLDIESETVTNLEAIQSSDYTVNPPAITGDYIKFSFASGTTTTGNNWDIAFRGTSILVNGGSATADDQPSRGTVAGVYITTGSLASVAEVNTSLLKQDSEQNGLAITTGSGNGWYNYNPDTHLIAPIAGKIIVVKTSNGRYAKMEILSYYKDKDTSGDSQYYTFDFVYQPNEGVTTF